MTWSLDAPDYPHNRPPNARRSQQRRPPIVYLGLVTLAIALITFVRLLHHPSPMPSSATTTVVDRVTQEIPIETFPVAGRWKAVHAALEMPALPDHVVVAPAALRDKASLTRSELRRRHEASKLPPLAPPPPHALHFIPEEWEETRAAPSLEEVARSFRAVALYEKAVAVEAARLRRLATGENAARSARRGPSWSVVKGVRE